VFYVGFFPRPCHTTAGFEIRNFEILWDIKLDQTEFTIIISAAKV
jgi:hypothetical protein